MKNKFPLFVGVIVGLLALLAVKSYVKRVDEQAKAQLRGDLVLVTASDVPAGAEIAPQMIKEKEVPAQFIPTQAIQGADERKQIVGRRVRYPIKAGQILLWTDLATESRGGLSTLIPAGEGAFTVSISRGVKTGLVQPSDHIDIIGSFAIPNTDKDGAGTSAAWREVSDMVNVVLLQNVTVLAVGDSFGGVVRSSGGPGADVTLALTLQEAQLLMFASQHGELGALLRREGSLEKEDRANLPRVTFEQIEKIIGDLDGQRTMRTIEVQKGVRTDSVPVYNPPLK